MRLRLVWAATLAAVSAGATAGSAVVFTGGGRPTHAITTSDGHPSNASGGEASSAGTGRRTAGTAGTAGTATAEVVADCDGAGPTGSLVSRDPATIVIACADGGIGIQHLRWTAWRDTSATGTGWVWMNLCTPDCADGTVAHYRASVRLSAVVESTSGPVFTVVSLSYPGSRPTSATGQVLSRFTLWYPDADRRGPQAPS